MVSLKNTKGKIFRNRIRKTITFKPEILSKIYKERGERPLSTFVNDFFENHFNLKIKVKGGKEK